MSFSRVRFPAEVLSGVMQPGWGRRVLISIECRDGALSPPSPPPLRFHGLKTEECVTSAFNLTVNKLGRISGAKLYCVQ